MLEKLSSGEPARLIPIVADSNKEQRAASVLLSILPKVPQLAERMLDGTGQRIGQRTRISALTEVVFKSNSDDRSRPDGLLILETGRRTWSALIEAKIGKAKLEEEQIRWYLELARDQGVDAVISISNKFVARADHHPLNPRGPLLRNVAFYHWS